MGTMDGINIVVETETTLPQDKGKGVDTSEGVEKLRVRTTYKKKHVGQRSSRGWLTRVIEEEEDNPED